MIRIVNKKSFRGQGYYVGRPSPLGNPFEIGKDGTREEVIDKYREWLRQQWIDNGHVRRELEKLVMVYKTIGKLILVCWCAPEACHADVIKDAVEKITVV